MEWSVVESGKCRAETGFNEEWRLGSGDWRVESREWTVNGGFVVCSDSVVHDAFHLRKFHVEYLHLVL